MTQALNRDHYWVMNGRYFHREKTCTEKQNLMTRN